MHKEFVKATYSLCFNVYYYMTEYQKTLNHPIHFTGKGLHTGLHVTMTVYPADENHGIQFKRIDLESKPVVAALVENVVDTSRSTTIARGEAKVSTIEHLMAALWGCGIDNALIEIDSQEAPILDGSAKAYVEEIERVGIKEQKAILEYYTIREKIEYVDEERDVKLVVFPDDSFSANVNIDFNSKIVGKQFAALNDIKDCATEIAPCRTFVFLHELEPLITNNLIKGGDVDNAIVIVENEIDNEQKQRLNELFGREINVTNKGYLNNIELRHENEIARHKLLDLIGDLYLVGVRIKGKVFATRPGHSANVKLSSLLRKQYKADSSKPKFKYDPDATPIYDINQIKDIIPHRPPFLLVDKIMAMDEKSVYGIKNVTMNEGFFVGHFPEEPVMPGVLIIEAMAQCGGILALSSVEDPECYSTYFLKIDEVKFKRKVVPGDTLLFALELTEPIRRGIVKMSAKAYVGSNLATEALLVAQISKNKQ